MEVVGRAGNPRERSELFPTSLNCFCCKGYSRNCSCQISGSEVCARCLQVDLAPPVVVNEKENLNDANR
jgi:hypothetical protein